MTRLLAAVPATLPDDLEDLAARVEAVLEHGGWRAMSPTAVARAVRCDVSQATAVLAWLVGHQLAVASSGGQFHSPDRNRRKDFP